MRWIAPLMLMMLLTGCNTPATYIHTCPVPKEYTQAQKDRAKQEAHLLPPGSEIGEMIKDYAVLHQQAKDCWAH